MPCGNATHTMPHVLRSLIAYCALLILLGAALPAPGPVSGAPASSAQNRYIVRLVAAPLPATTLTPAQANGHARTLAGALTAISAAVAEPVTPVFSYRHALSGFALDLRPAQAARVAALPGVAAIQPERIATLHSDSSPNLLGVAQTDLSPALFHAQLTGPSGASGRAIAHYEAESATLSLQIFYRGLAAAPAVAELRALNGTQRLDLMPLAVDPPGAAGGYIGTLALPALAQAALRAGKLEIRLDTLQGVLVPSRGEGVLVGVIDSGIEPNSPSFQDPAPDGYVYQNPRGAADFLGVCDPAHERYDASFACNNKLLGAYTFAATADTPDPQGRPSPHDNHPGHGSHTAGTAVGNYVPAIAVGLAALGPVAGVAPRANLIVYDACGVPENDFNCPQSALLAALDQAIADGVAVLNYSIGAGAGNPWTELEALAMLRALDAGIFVAASAGNRGPVPDSLSTPANAPWVTAVAAGTHGRRLISQLNDFSGGDPTLRPSAPLIGAGFAPPLAQTLLRSAAAVGNPDCARFSEAEQAQIAGMIVVCAPGQVGRFDQSYNVRDAGGAGVVLLNSVSDGAQLDEEERYPLPAAQLSYADGQRLSAWLSGCNDCRATLSGTQTQRLPGAAEQLYFRSSRGPNGHVPAVLKPNLAAPGQNILAPVSDIDPSQPDYFIATGSSMAAPQIAGLAALLRQLQPTWSPAEISSALMLTAAPLRLDDGTPASPFDQGAGRAQGALAAFVGFVLPEQASAFAAADPAYDGEPAQLNLAGLASADCARSCSFTRTLRSTLAVSATYDIVLTDGAGFSLSSAPAGTITLAPGASTTLVVTATINGLATGSYSYGAVSLRARGGLAPTATLPVALQTFGANLPPEVAISTSDSMGSQVLNLRSEAINRLETQVYGLVPMQREQHSLAPGAWLERELTLPPDSLLLRVELASHNLPGLELFVYADRNADSQIQASELLCAATTVRCELAADTLADELVAGHALRLSIHNSDAEAVAGHTSFQLHYGLVRSTTPAASNLSVSGPVSVAAGEPFALNLTWQLANHPRGTRYLGLLSVRDAGDGLSAARALGTASLTLDFVGSQLYLPLLTR